MREAIKDIRLTLAAHQGDLAAKAQDLAEKQRNLDEKGAHLDVLTAFSNAARVMLMAIQHTISLDPQQAAALGPIVATLRENYQNGLLFTTVSDVSISEIQKDIDRLLLPSAKLPPQQP
ncbi:hypothetical protein [Acidovorax sp. NCPPB 3576]|uniref:hypothetical protein n=1 Tax=Acidovorax sp. NCPPB 3576 TaxID=2940488 RepID=UPI00234A6125|nr:hypothetical protein [Acidovorax sp. NCPPB 3576]WCM86666.1 hypothetical protein M5C98_14895 [Acidovorax sp. NCPPB 3576]